MSQWITEKVTYLKYYMNLKHGIIALVQPI